MTVPRLKTSLWVAAQVRQCDKAFIPVVVARRGDPDSGQVLIKRNRLNGTFEVFARTLTLEGDPAWRCAAGPGNESDADRFIDSETRFDPDLWVLEIEDPTAQYTHDAPVI